MRYFWVILCAVVCFGANALAESASSSHDLKLGELTRDYLVHRPAGLSHDTPVPLVIFMHGGFGTASMSEGTYNWDGEADKAGFVVAYLDGVHRSWNAGGNCCGASAKENVDDVAFITQVIDAISKSENIDPKRVYLTGISNGAAMSYRYACEGPYPIAAIGSVAGSFSFPCRIQHPISVMEIHGLDDQNIPIEGGTGPKSRIPVQWMPVHETIDAFRAVASCQPPVLQQSGPVHKAQSPCALGRDVTLITIDGAGHQWPGSKPKGALISGLLSLDPPSTAMDATSALWAFFNAHPAP